MTEQNAYAWWELALTGEKIGGPKLPVHEGIPEIGFFRKRKFKGGPWQAVAIFEDGGKIVAMVDDTMVDPSDIWTFVCRNPVSYDDYNQFRAGNGWPDDDKTVSAQIEASPGIGDNSGVVDEVEALKDQIDNALKGADAYVKISDDATASKAQSLRNRLNELSGNAKKIHDKEKEPFLEGGKAVDAKWLPMVKSAKAGADKIRKAMDDWETVKLNAERKRQADIAAEQARIATQSFTDAKSDADGSDVAETATVPTVAKPSSVSASYGKAASVQVKTVVKEVTDWQALAIYMSAHGELRELLMKLAQRAVDAGRTDVPGIVLEEVAKVK